MARKSLTPILLVLFVVIMTTVLGSATWLASFAVLTGNTNYVVYPDGGTLQTSYSVTTSIDGGDVGGHTLLGCSAVSGNWDVQNNLLQASWIQQIVVVSLSGNSCYSVEFFPNFGVTKVPYYYSFQIGYSSEFYDSGYGATFTTQATSLGSGDYQVTDWYVSVASDEWVIYPSNFNSTQTVVYSTSVSKGNFVFVGIADCDTAAFTAGAGTISYSTSDWTTSSTAGSQSCEKGQISYGTISSGSQAFSR